MLVPCSIFSRTATNTAAITTITGNIQMYGKRTRCGGSGTAAGKSSRDPPGRSVMALGIPKQALVERLGGEHGEHDHGGEGECAGTDLHDREGLNLNERHQNR